MADTKITQLATLASLADADLFVAIDDVAGTPTSTAVRADKLRSYTSRFYATTTAEANAAVTITDDSEEEGSWDRYNDPATEIPLVYAQVSAPRINFNNYLDGDAVILGNPSTSSFGNGSDAIQTALDLAEDINASAVRFTGDWNGLSPQAVDPAALGRTACVYIPPGVSFIGPGSQRGAPGTRMRLADAANAQLIVAKDPTAASQSFTVEGFYADGNKANQTGDGGGALIELLYTGGNNPNYVTVRNMRIGASFGRLFNTDMSVSQFYNIHGRSGGKTGSTVQDTQMSFGGGDNIICMIDCGMSDGAGIGISSGDSQYALIKSWRAGEVDTANGYGFVMSMGNSGSRGDFYSQHCAAGCAKIFSTGTAKGVDLVLHTSGDGGPILLGAAIEDSYIRITSDYDVSIYAEASLLDLNTSGAACERNKIEIFKDSNFTGSAIESGSRAFGTNNITIETRQKTPFTFVYAASYEIDCESYEYVKTTLTGDITITTSGEQPGMKLVVFLTQNATGGHTPTFSGANFALGITASAETLNKRSKWIFTFDPDVGKFVQDSALVDF